MENNIKDKVTVVVGASGGIGGEAARLLVEGGGIAINASRTACNIEGVENHLVDVEKMETVEAAIDEILTKHGRIDNFIYAAGDSLAAPFEHTKSEDLRHIFEVNFFGLASSLKKIIPHMRINRVGRVVAISSMGGSVPIKFDPFYSASKAAVDMLITELNLELNEYGVYLTSLLPGGTRTQFSQRRKVYRCDECGCYAEDVHRAASALKSIEQNGVSAESVGKSVLNVLSRKKPPAIMAVGMGNKARLAMYNILPQAVTMPITKGAFE